MKLTTLLQTEIFQSTRYNRATHWPLRCVALIVGLALSGAGEMANAADGDLDPTFGSGGSVTTDFQRSTDIANAVALQSDGKLVVAGTTYTDNDYTGEDLLLSATIPTEPSTRTFGMNGKR